MSRVRPFCFDSFVAKHRRLLFAALAAATLVACHQDAATSPPEETPPVQLPDADVSSVPAHDPGSVLPSDWKRGPFIEIYVRVYKDSDGDGIGDLRGLTQQLDYLKSLGATVIWLMPVTRSQDHDHGHAVSDYRAIEAQYGSLADLDSLLAHAHARGIGVIMDYVMNHSAAQNPLFLNANGATNGAPSAVDGNGQFVIATPPRSVVVYLLAR